MALQRSNDQILGGVCGGLAEEWDLDPTLVRVLYVVLTLLSTGLGLVLYLILYLVMDDPGAAV
jgi:phage shock protein C